MFIFQRVLIPLVLISTIIFSGTVFAQDKPSLKWNGYTQATMIKSENYKSFIFGFERVRIGLSGALNEKMDYKLLFDLIDTPDGIGPSGETPKIINYAMVTVKPYKALRLSVGKMKVPVGMEWNTAAHSLDFVKRGYAQKFIFHFDTGAMLHMSNIGKHGLGFAFGVFNAGPNKATNVGDPKNGNDYTLAGRVSADPVKSLHAELYWGSALTSVQDQKDVTVAGAGIKWYPANTIELKGEYITRDDQQNIASDGAVYYCQAGYLLFPFAQPIIKYENDDISADSYDQTTITLGCNFFLNPNKRKESKIQINYVISDMEGQDSFQVLFQGAF